MKKILIVEDDELILELEKDYLRAAGYEVDTCMDGLEGFKLATEGVYDLLLLDLMLDGMDGFEICRKIRKTKDVPIILVTAIGDDLHKIQGLGLGANDYITKPFSPSELVARVNAHIKTHERLLSSSNNSQVAEDIIELGNLKIQSLSRKVFVDDNEIILKNKEFELLLFLASNPNFVFSSEALYNRIWGMYANGNTKTVAVHINRLREKIEKNPSSPELIQTVRGVGYRFVAKC